MEEMWNICDTWIVLNEKHSDNKIEYLVNKKSNKNLYTFLT